MRCAHETTDDAYTTGYIHQISSRVTGNVIQLLIQDNQFVHQGDRSCCGSTRPITRCRWSEAQANYDKAKADFDRVDALKNDVAISKQDYDQTKNNFEVAKAALEDANNQLGYCTVVAPTDGFIGNRTVNVGNRVTVGGALMAVMQDVWVVANYKETQLGKMKKHQRVQITVDAIPQPDLPGSHRQFFSGHGLDLRPAAARQRDGKLHQDRAARAGEDPLRAGQHREFPQPPGARACRWRPRSTSTSRWNR